MAWIESHQSLGSHPKTKKLCRVLRLSKPESVGYLHMLWWWALDYAQDGDLSRYEAMDIAIGAEWEGDEQAFVDALVTAGFLERDDGGIRIHDWHDYAGKLIERRARNAARMRDARAEYEPGTNDARDDTNEPCASHVQGTMHARVQLPTQPTKPNQPTAPAKPSNGRADAAAADSYSSIITGANSYQAIIGETTCTKVAEQFRRIDASLVPGWFGGMLRTAQSQCGPAHRPQLEEAVKVTLSEVERRLAAEKNGGGVPVVSVKKFTEAVFVRNLSDALGVAR